LSIGTQPVSECTQNLLPFFAPLITNGQTLTVGVRWTVDADNAAASEATKYEVTGVSDSGVTLHETQSIKVKGAIGMDSTIDGTVLYDPSKLVAISGKFDRHSSNSGPSTSTTEEMIMDFSSTSDTLAPSK
jgi:hypothetical protein